MMVIGGLSASASAQSDEALPVFAAFDGQPVLQSSATPEMLSPRWVTPRLAVLDAASIGQQLLFEFADSVSYIGVVEAVTRRDAQRYTLTGSLGNDGMGYFIISREQEALAGVFHAPADSFLAEMRFAGDGAHWLYEVDENQRPLCAGSPQAPVGNQRADDGDPVATGDGGARGSRVTTSCPPTQPIQDYLVVYTDLARQAAGGASAIRGIIQNYVAYTNMAYGNSGIDLRMRMVHCAEVVYDEVDPPGGDDPFETHLNRLTDISDGIMDEVYSWRQTYAADAVMLLLDDSSSGGLAWCCADDTYAYAVMYWDNGANTFAHEFGHNQGGAHNPGDVDCTGCDSYSRGHVFVGDDDVQYGTVMSYPGQRIQYFSNPDVEFQGVPTGIADERDNARTIRARRDTVEGFRTTRFDIWVDFDASGTQAGTPALPYASLTTAVDQVPTARHYSELPNLWIEAGHTSEILTINKPMTLNACGGTVWIGG
jgi:hypothetical protein